MEKAIKIKKIIEALENEGIHLSKSLGEIKQKYGNDLIILEFKWKEK